jgi:hypothetical protein
VRPVVAVFGCFHPPGHRLYDPSKTVQPGERSWLEVQLDGMPDPAIRRTLGEPEGHVYRATNTAQVEAAGWSMVHWWDRQGDQRGGSHTCLAARGVWTAEELIAAGREQVPWAFRVEVKL